MLSKEQVDFYQDQGYLLPDKPLFSAKKLSNIENLFEEYSNWKSDLPTDELDTPHLYDSRLLKYLLDPGVLDIIECLIGPNIGLWSSHFISKPTRTGRRTPWHEDSAYWEGKFDRLDKIVTIWLAIDDSNRENGCMGVIPGSHLDGFSNYSKVSDRENSTFDSEIDKSKIEKDKIVWFELNKGQFSIHDGRIIHGAGPNKSPYRRCGYTMRYFALDMKFNPKMAPGHKLWHARGKNIGNNPLLPNPYA